MILYHCTDNFYKNKILIEGLRIEKSLSKGKIFLSKSPEYCYGNTCFIVNANGLDIKQTENSWEYVYNESISPDRIRYYGYKELD